MDASANVTFAKLPEIGMNIELGTAVTAVGWDPSLEEFMLRRY